MFSMAFPPISLFDLLPERSNQKSVERELEAFSKRRQAILARAGEGATVRERNLAWKNTRKKKELVPSEELKARWAIEAETLGIEIIKAEGRSQKLEGKVPNLSDAISRCSERTVAFLQEDLEKFLLDSPQPIVFEQIQDNLRDRPELIRLATEIDTRYTTQAALMRELATIRLMLAGKNQWESILRADEVDRVLAPLTLTEGQRQAIALNSTDAFLARSLRQRTPQLQIAVDLIAKGEIEAGFERLDEIGCFVSVTEENKVARIVADYLALAPTEREQTLILAGTNAERLALVRGIREGLKGEKQLGTRSQWKAESKKKQKQAIDLVQLKNKGLTAVQMNYAHHLEIGDYVVPSCDCKGRGLEKGRPFEIVAKQGDLIVLKDEWETKRFVDTTFQKTVYSADKLEIAVGERLDLLQKFHKRVINRS
jgi:hypothetical protein